MRARALLELKQRLAGAIIDAWQKTCGIHPLLMAVHYSTTRNTNPKPCCSCYSPRWLPNQDSWSRLMRALRSSAFSASQVPNLQAVKVLAGDVGSKQEAAAKKIQARRKQSCSARREEDITFES